MELDERSQEKLQELQILEHNLQNILMQKQAFQLELNETLNALSEVEKTKDSVYKIIGSVMLKAEKEKILQELKEKKNLLELRNNSLDKQQSLIESKAKDIQEELKKLFEKDSRDKTLKTH